MRWDDEDYSTNWLSVAPDARDELRKRMHDGISPSKEIEAFQRDGLQVVDGTHLTAAAMAIREAILSGRLSLFALLSSGHAPMRLHSRELVEAALLPPGSTVLTFAYIDRHQRAPFGLSWLDLKELTRDPLCVEERPFRVWLRKEDRKKAWPCHDLCSTRRRRGRPSSLSHEVLDVLEELAASGKVAPRQRNKEVHALVRKARPSLRDVSIETVRLARKDFRQVD